MSMTEDFAGLTGFPVVPHDVVVPAGTTPAPNAAPQPASEQSEQTAKQKPAGAAHYHRLAEIRRQQGISVRSASRRMGIPMEQVRREEKPGSNLSMEDLARWQRAMEVPLIDLLVDENSPLSTPVLERAKWLRLMKTVKAIIEASEEPGITRMAQMLEQQVTEVMPELADVSGWHSIGQRRTQDEVGRIAEAPVSGSFAREGLG